MNTEEQKEISEHFERMWQAGLTPWLSHRPEPLLKEFFASLKFVLHSLEDFISQYN